MKGSPSRARFPCELDQMSKVYPCIPRCSSSSSSSSTSHERRIFTIWMKSLLVNGYGYTIYDSNGNVVYRIDNYDSKSCSEVYLMDLQGKVLCTILQKRFFISGLWDGYKGNDCRAKGVKPWFRVRKDSKFLKKDSTILFHATLEIDEAQRSSSYKMEGSIRKPDLKITDMDRRVVAEVKQKQSLSGVVLGDVLTLTVEPLIDHSLVMALVAVYELIRHKI